MRAGGDTDGATPPLVPPPTPRPAAEPATLGLRVILRAIPGLTRPGLLQVPFLFQCPPLEDFTEEFAYAHTDFNTAFGGERSRPGGAALDSWSFSTLVLDDLPSWSFIQSFVPHPILVKRELKHILKTGTPVQLLVHQLPLWDYYDVNSPVTLRSLTSQEKAGEPDARYFAMQFREYRPMAVKARLKGRGAPRGSRRGPHPISVLVRSLPDSRSTLYLLAKHYYGSTSKWRDISAVQANGLTSVAPTQDLRVVFRRFPRKKITVPGVQSETVAKSAVEAETIVIRPEPVAP